MTKNKNNKHQGASCVREVQKNNNGGGRAKEGEHRK
jgi:hypothetical protein